MDIRLSDTIFSKAFIINYKKSCLSPTTACRFLGFVIDSVLMTVSLPQDRKKFLLGSVQRMLSTDSCKIKQFASLIGSLVAACPAIEYGWIYTKPLEREKFLALKASNNSFNAKM